MAATAPSVVRGAIPQIQFFSTVPLARLAVAEGTSDEGAGYDESDDNGPVDPWEEDVWSP